MNRVACCALALLSVLAAEAASAENLQPGRWRVLTTTLSGPLAPPQVATRCLTPEDVADPIKTFGPQASTVNSECERTEFRHEGAELKWRLQCRGQIDMDLTGQFIFDSPTRYSALITTKATMMERIVHDTMVSISAERIGECR